MDDEQLHRRLRSELGNRASGADVSSAARRRVTEGLGRPARRSGGRWVAVLGSAAVVATTIGLVAVVASGPDRSAPVPPASQTGTSSGPVPGAGAWRTEYWHDVRVTVPASWWYGGGLTDGGGIGRVACYPEPMVTPEGERREGRGASAPGYVGRPIALTDVCTGDGATLDGVPSWPYLWFDAPLVPGVEDLGGGWVRETVEANGSRVTVASDDDALRSRILGSVAGGETCLSSVEPAADTDVFPRTEGGDVADARRLTVCAYARPADRRGLPVADLTYAAQLGEDTVRDYLVALGAGDPPRDQCPTLDHAEGEWVVLELADEGGAVLRRDVVHLFCPGVDVGADTLQGLETVALTPAMVRPWAVGGVPAVVHGPTGGRGAMIDSFIGPQG